MLSMRPVGYQMHHRLSAARHSPDVVHMNTGWLSLPKDTGLVLLHRSLEPTRRSHQIITHLPKGVQASGVVGARCFPSGSQRSGLNCSAAGQYSGERW